MLAFIPIIMVNGSRKEAEGAVKYFLAQAVGSIFFLLGGLITAGTSVNFNFFIIFGLFMKAGMAPCHF